MKKLLLPILILFLTNAWGQKLKHAMIFRVNSPTEVAGDLKYGYASFGPERISTVSGDLAFANTAEGDHLGCTPIINNLAGKVALIDRGTCNLSTKIYNAQKQGAIGCVIINNEGTTEVVNMASGENSDLITIPSVLISVDDGKLLAAKVNAGVTTNVSFYVPPIAEAVIAYASQTPLAQVAELPVMAAYVYNAAATTVSDVGVTLDIIDPKGNKSSFAAPHAQIEGYQESTFEFQVKYTPTMLGTYKTIFRSTLAPGETFVKNFIVTENVFALDNSDFSHAYGVSVSDEDFRDHDFRFDLGAVYSLYNTIMNKRLTATFALENAASYLGEGFDIYLYKQPYDGFESAVDYSEMKEIAVNHHIIKESDLTAPNGLITVDLGDVSKLEGNLRYMLVVRYKGNGTITQAPMFKHTAADGFLDISSVIYNGVRFSFNGWNTDNMPILRLGIENCRDCAALGLNENSPENSIVVYPNPTKGKVTIEFKDTQENLNLSIFTIDSKLIDTKQVSNSKRVEYEIKEGKGVYLLEVLNAQKQKTVLRIIKE